MADSEVCTLPEGEEENAVLAIIKEECIVNYIKTVKLATQPGDNFMGLIYSVDIVGYDEKRPDVKRSLHLIVKCSPRSASFRQFVPAREIFEREIYIYTNYLPEIYKIQRKHQIQRGLLPGVKLYKYSTRENDEFLMMENMKMQNFTMHSRKFTLDFDHCKLVLEQLGYLHGLSYVLRRTKPHLYNEILEAIETRPDVEDQAEVWFKQFTDAVTRAINLLDAENEKDAYDKLTQLKDDVPNVMMQAFNFKSSAQERCSFIQHGDCWTNNILFKCNKTSCQPEELCFIDWQNARLASPAVDLSYFICTSTGTEFRNRYFDDMLKIYYDSLSYIIGQCDLDIKKWFSFGQLQEQVKKYYKFGILIACYAIPMFVSESDEVPEFQKNENFNESELKKWGVETKNKSLYEERIRGVIFHAISNNFL